MIPKIIHYCWFGGNPLPPLALKCIASWRKYLPEYEIREWNESNFDVYAIPYTKEAYQAKKYAFVSDYARFWILYNYGGIYFDTDVEVIKPLSDIIKKGAFMGCESEGKESVAPGLGMASPIKLPLIGDMVKFYAGIHFINVDGSQNVTTIVKYTSDILKRKGLIDKEGIQWIEGVYVYPRDYFCPIDFRTTKKYFTENTRTIHHYSASWHTPFQSFKMKVVRLLGRDISNILFKIKRVFSR